MAPQARALVLEVPTDEEPTFATWGSEIISEALAHGLRVALVQYEPESTLPLAEDQEAVDKFFAAVKSLRRDPTRALALYRDWARVAKWARDHIPGPGASADLVIDGAVPKGLETDLLIRRAFNDLRSVTLEVLSGGKSGAAVWRVRPSEADRSLRALPFVVKIHDREKMLAEKSNCFIVKNAVESRLYVPLHAERCVEGDELGLVVYDVVDRAIQFRSALTVAPDALVASLFGQTLNAFRACAASGFGQIVPEFGPGRLKVLRWSDALREAAELARVRTPTLPEVDTLRMLLSDMPAMRFTSAVVHGDLHAGNLFVLANSTDVLMIDYGSVLQNAPAVADPACLEVSLVFPGMDVTRAVNDPRSNDDWRRAAYQYPLESAVVPRVYGTEAWLPQAIKAVRAHARMVDPHPVTYGIAVASYLIRFASFDDHASTVERALAYELACDIVASAVHDLPVSNSSISGTA